MTVTAYYLSVEEALELHRMLIERFGGSPGVRDLGLVESAI
jgi:death-on-curing protein